MTSVDSPGGAVGHSGHARFLDVVWGESGWPLAVLLAGIALGPSGLALLTAPVLTAIDPAITVALAAFGILLGLTLTRARHAPRLMLMAAVEATVTLVVVAAGLLVVLMQRLDLSGPQAVASAIAIGICAAPSSALHRSGMRGTSAWRRAIELDAFIPIVAGGLWLAWAREPASGAAAGLLLQAVLVAVIVAAAAWLLLSESPSHNERRVFSAAAVLLLGGTADYLQLSPLLAGLVAGVCWGLMGGDVADTMGLEIEWLRRPLLVVLMLTAGARLVAAPPIFALFVCVTLRLSIKAIAGLAAARRGHSNARASFVSDAVAPGVFGIALAMSLTRASSGIADLVLATVVTTVLVLHLLTSFVRRPEFEA
jgi:hypothetical protein